MNSVASRAISHWPIARVACKKRRRSLSQPRIAETRKPSPTATRLELEQKKLPAEILARHDQAVAQFEQRAAQFNQIALKIQTSQPLAQQNIAQEAPETIASSGTTSTQPLDELNTFFAQYPSSKRAAPSFDWVW
jgi:hypothetical protein